MFESLFAYHPPSPSVENTKANEVDYAKNPTKLFKRIEGRAWESAMERIHSDPSEVKIWVLKRGFDGSITWRRLPLHEACIRKPTQKVVKALLSVFHEASSIQDSDGRLPLHHACANGASTDVIETLLVAFPEAIDTKDGWQKTPLQTLMSQFFPDPHCISALKRGVPYYKSKAMNNSYTNQNHPIISRSLSYQGPSTPSLRYDGGIKSIHDVESEIGRFTHKLAMNSDKERNLQNRIRFLEDGVSRLSEVESENLKLNTTVRDLAHELELVRDAFENERQQNSRNLQVIDDMRRLEDDLKHQIDDLANDPTKRILEEKVSSLGTELQEKDIRYERDIQNLQNMLRNAEREAEAASSAAHKFETESKNMQLELQKMGYDNESQSNALSHLKRELATMNDLRLKMDDTERDRQNLDNEIRRLSRNLQMAEQEISNLRQENYDLSQMTNELKRRSSNHAMDLQDDLRHKENETKRLEEEIHQLKKIEKELKQSFDEEKKELKKSADYLMEELQRVQKENILQLKEKVEYEKQLEDMQLKLANSTRKVNETSDKEVQRSKELEALKVDMEHKTGELTKKLLQEQSRCLDVERELKLLKQHVKITTSASNEATKQVLELKRRNKDHLQEIQSLQDEKQKLEKELSHSRIVREQIESRELGLGNKCKEMQLQLDEMSKDRITLESEKQQLQSRTLELENENKTLKTTVETEQGAVQSLKEEIQRDRESFDVERTQMSQRIKALQSQLDEKTLNNDREKSLGNYSNENNNDEELKRFQNEIVSLTEALKLREGEISFLRFTLEKKERDSNSVGISNNCNHDDSSKFLDQLENLKQENSMLRALLEENDDQSNSSLSYLEERLLALEKVKDSEISMLLQERDELTREIETLKDRIVTLEGEIAKVKEDNRYSNSQIAILRNKRDRKKKTIEERLKDYETRSCASSVVTRERFQPKSEVHDGLSVVSGISFDAPTTTTKTIGPKARPTTISLSHENYTPGNALLLKSQAHNHPEYLFPSTMPITGMRFSGPSEFSNVNTFRPDKIPTMISTSTASTDSSKSNLLLKETRDDIGAYDSRTSQSIKDGILALN